MNSSGFWVTAAAQERHLSEDTLTAYLRAWLRLTAESVKKSLGVFGTPKNLTQRIEYHSKIVLRYSRITLRIGCI
jgi:hypothetical protein